MFANNYRPWRDGFLPLPFLSCHPTPPPPSLLGLRGHGRAGEGGGRGRFVWFNTVSHESNISLYINYRQLKGGKKWNGKLRDYGMAMEVDASNNGSNFLPETTVRGSRIEDRGSHGSRSTDDG